MVTHEFVATSTEQTNHHQKDHNKNEQIANYYYNHLAIYAIHAHGYFDQCKHKHCYITGIDSNMIY